MSKFCCEFNERSTQWCNNPEYNKLFVESRIQYFKDIMKIHGVVILKEALDAFGIDISNIDISILTRYWNDGDVDISYTDLGYNRYKLTFNTDN